jgi:hypothetical protein
LAVVPRSLAEGALHVDGRTSLGDPNWTREGPFCVVADVPKRDLPGPFSYVESFSTPTGPSSFGAAYPAASVPNEEPVAPRSGRDTTPAASWAFAQSRLPRRLLEAHSRRALPLPLQPSGIPLRSSSRRMRRRVRDHPPSACGSRSGGHEPRERSTQRASGSAYRTRRSKTERRVVTRRRYRS